MIKINKLTKALGTAALVLGANVALAETVTVPASVTVNNAIDFTFTGELNFGEIRAEADPTVDLCVGLLMPANPASALEDVAPAACTGPGDAVIQSIGGTVTRPEFTVAGTSPFSTMNLTLPDGNVAVTASTGPDTPQFFLSTFTAYRTGTSPGTIAIDGSGAGTFQTNASGGATFTVGATLGTHLLTSNTANYQDLAYTGSFDVEVTY